MTRHYPGLGSASDWLYRMGNLIQPIKTTTQIWLVMRHLRSFLRCHLAGKPVAVSPNRHMSAVFSICYFYFAMVFLQNHV